MANIVASYVKFLQTHGSVAGDVDMSPFFDLRTRWTPVNLEYTNKDKSLQLISGEILRNLAETYKDQATFPKRLLEDLEHIVLGEADDYKVAQRISLLHMSKRKIDVQFFTLIVAETNAMRVKHVVDPDEWLWRELGNKVLNHKEINRIIDEAIVKLGVPVKSINAAEIQITFVTKSIEFLRGFVGIDEIFIHVDNFHSKISSFRGNIDLLQNIAKMDIMSLFIHELAHLKIRSSANDFNFSTPVAASLAGIAPALKSQHEFGAYVEKQVFGKQVQWYHTATMLETTGKSYIAAFISAVEKNERLPDNSIQKQLIPRLGCPYSVSGMDMVFEMEIC